MFLNKEIPIPIFKVNRQLDIIENSNQVTKIFEPASNFLVLVDEGSQKKVSHLLLEETTRSFETNLRTLTNPISLFQLYVSWEGEGTSGYVVCMEKESDYLLSTQTLHKLREELHSVDFKRYEAELRKEMLPSLLNINLSDLSRLSLNEYAGSLEDIPAKIDTVLDLISVLRPELIEIGKSDYLDLVTTELTSISAIIHYLIAVSPPKGHDI
ncbi:hypothetical protein [Halalkalibacter akibai]|uniref:Uncharacterized protein n=1 Tax=Halalkalibacter akibai (strain ATCC 43226 / DSM 21942 / CIP 109018 / JCM 9157 / 1139) TaxID=1236973 RepID=W4QYX5_HALA3|nr:hypothetical protein [Halalkalibacter akibai]GAE37350.1 hypothetical protein JCM9157_4624 [Halalkalibacter akibai JCM 9157]